MDLILINGRFLTMNEGNSVCEAVAVKNGKIAGIGTSKEMLELADALTEVIDLKGKTVVPGFNDSHVHLLNYGYSLNKIDLSGAESIEEVIEISREYIKNNNPKPGEWVQGRGWNNIKFKENRELTKHDLDKISTEHPLSFSRICEHVTVGNSRAIEEAGIKKDTPQPVGGHFDIDSDGSPLGIFRETARYMIYDIIPDYTIQQIKDMILGAAKIASSYGVTSVQTDDFEALPSKNYKNVLRAYKELSEEGLLPVRVYEQCLLPEIKRLKDFLDEGYRTGIGNDFFKIGPLKLLTDGSLGARTAYLRQPYSDAPDTRGIPVFTQEELDELVLTASKGGMQVLTHAIGDGAMYMCLESFEKAKKAMPERDLRYGIVHLQITDETIIRRFKELNVIAYEEPITLANDLHMVESRVGKERAAASYNYKSFFDIGVHVAMSSDCPVDSINPMKNIYAGVNRMDYNGYPEGGWRPEQCLSIDQALYGFTMGSAYASFDEKVKGSIEVGKFADMAVLAEDIYSIDKKEIQNIKVDMTILDGKKVFIR